MEEIEKLYREKIDLELLSLFNADSLLVIERLREEEFKKLKQKIREHPQAISKRKELEIYLRTINDFLAIQLDNSTSQICHTCVHYPSGSKILLDNVRKCSKGYDINIVVLDRVVCGDYGADKNKETFRDTRNRKIVGLLSELKQQKLAELEQYQDQFSLERRLR